MNWRDLTARMREWSGWRRHAPAGLSVIVHVGVVAGLASMLAATEPLAPPKSPQLMLAVDLLPEEIVLPEPEIEAGVTPPPRPQVTPAETRDAPATTAQPAAPVAPEAPGAETGDSVYLGAPSVLIDPTAPPGLRGLAGNDPCAVRVGPKPRECAGRELAARTGDMDSVMPRSKEELAQHYAEFMPTCAFRVGCEGGEWISTNGTRGVGRPAPGSANDRGVGTPGAAGASSLGGLHTSVGRLGFNPDHKDTGFGD
jgi:hypothetical protein